MSESLKKPSATIAKPTDWTLCALCQEHSDNEPIRDARRAINQSSRDVHGTLARNLKALSDLNVLPFGINISRLDDGCGIAETLANHDAKWHKNCYVQCSSSRVARAESRVRKRSEDIEHGQETNSPVKKRLRTSFVSSPIGQSTTCFFCDAVIRDDVVVHMAATTNLDSNVRFMATELRDTKLLARLSVGDMTASDAVYHKKCMTALHSRYRSFVRKKERTSQTEDMQPESVALAELISYLEDMKCTDDTTTIFKLADLVKLYTERLEQLGGNTSKRINSTRLKAKLLSEVPQLEAHKSNNNEVVLSFKQDIGKVLLCASQNTSDDDAVVLMRAAQIVRKDIFQMKYHFEGSLVDEAYNSSAASLMALMRMILSGTNIKKQTEICNEVSGPVQSLTELVTFNTIKRGRSETAAVGLRHNLERETSLPLYLGLLVHNKTRKRDLVDVLYQRGLSVSYDRVLQVSTDEANRVIEIYEHDNVVCPTKLRNGLFTTGNLDNIDHNPSSTSARSSFHGTAISLTQHVSRDKSGIVRDLGGVGGNKNQHLKSINALPITYSDVPPAAYPTNSPVPRKPKVSSTATAPSRTQDKESQWLSFVHNVQEKESLDSENNLSWSAYMANQQVEVPRPPAITGLLPLFRESAHTLAMVKHGMNVIQQATEHVNPIQVPVLTVDQPLYAIAKKIQWTWPRVYGEDKFVVMMGGLHVEMALLKVIGDFLEGSGWVAVMTSAGVTTEGRADSLQKGSQTSRSQWAHQVTAAALYTLQRKAYDDYHKTSTDEDLLSFECWCQKMDTDHPQFCYWNKVLQLECLLLAFIRSQREADYPQYVETLTTIIPWMFATDHYHYARWLTVHVTDLNELPNDSPDTHREFVEGNFVTQKSSHKFSALAHDQIHEQQNAIVKGDGGIVGITENEAALRRWMMAGPEIARILNEFEDQFQRRKEIDVRHHEQLPSIQKSFASDLKNAISTFEKLGNPFSEDSKDLYVLDTKVIMSDEVVATVRSVEDIGKKQFSEFVKQRVLNPSASFYDNIKKNNLQLFKSKQKKTASKSQAKVASMKNDVQLFSRMYIACQARDGNLDSFFEHECHSWPPALAEGINNMRPPTGKADLLPCLEALAPHPHDNPKADACIFDGAALVHQLEPTKCNSVVRTFGDYVQKQFLPYVARKLNEETVMRVDVVWDTYRKDSLKEGTRLGRGTGTPLHMTEQTSVPRNWSSFLRVDSNKKALFRYLAAALETMPVPPGKTLLTTQEEEVLSNPPSGVSQLQPCTHEEADSRMLLHAWHAYQQGYRSIVIHATDTDVVVIAIAVASVMGSCEVWMAFGHGNKFRHIAAHTIATHIGHERAWGLLFLHAVSGCDTVSAISGIGKKTVWDIWNSMPNLGKVFKHLSHAPAEVTNDHMDEIERFFVLLYSRTSPLKNVNEARKQLFAHGNRQVENIPPTKEALRQHVKRAAFQAGHVWGQSQIPNPEVPSPHEWGWVKSDKDGWHPFWTVMPEASKGCRELIRCQCKKRCAGNCKCFAANLPCTELCFCSGQCFQD